ncbi:DUF742 domain-containing protein [Streptomyces spectabilis]|uniref:DUF742 domain-containing protein n=1 Tax=Streptomyces spectabilis TaxID=68270 RepID=UPI0033CA3800
MTFSGPSWTRTSGVGACHFVLTGGQTQFHPALGVETLLAARGAPPGNLGPEARAAHMLCRTTRLSVADIAAQLRLPLPVTRVMLSQLLDAGALHIASAPYHPSDTAILEKLLAKLHEL